jgi:hypothetical protein
MDDMLMRVGWKCVRTSWSGRFRACGRLSLTGSLLFSGPYRFVSKLDGLGGKRGGLFLGFLEKRTHFWNPQKPM